MKRRAAFTLVEVLAAMAFLAILVPVLVAAMHTANRSAVIAERAAIATQLGENQLNDLIVENLWSSGSNQGDFGADYPGYRWELQTTDWTEYTGLSELTMVVYYQVQGQEHSLQLATLVQTQTTQ
jgi:type II secretory pathway pseudopilin PulG